MRKTVLFIILMCAMLTIGCAPPGHNPVQGTAGYPEGFFHGFALMINYLFSMLSDDIGIYEINNNGFPYNFGFFMGVTAFFYGPNLTIRLCTKKS